jgi:tripartite-type tricarboxylate transporter receptor subunit TctC
MSSIPFPRRTFGAALLLGAAGAAAQTGQIWPERPVRLVNSGAAGSGIDLIARILSEGLARRLNQPFPVENRPGAGAVLAAQAHATARPGETLLLGATGIASTLPFTFEGRLPFDADADLVPIAIPASEFLCLAVQGELPVRSLTELVALIRARPGALNWNSVPGFVDLDLRLFLHEHRLEASFVAYPGSPPAIMDLAAGRIHFGVLPLTPLLSMIREGRIRALAITSGERAPSLPDTPTMSEAGFPDLAYDPFTALFGWRGMAPLLRDQLGGLVRDIMAEPAAAQRLRQAGIQPRGGDAAALAEVIALQRRQVQTALQTVGRRPPG